MEGGRGLAGWFDGMADGLIHGWVADPDRPARRFSVTLTVDGRPLATVTADRFRADIAAAGVGDGAYCFQVPAPPILADGHTHRLEAMVEETGVPLAGGPHEITIPLHGVGVMGTPLFIIGAPRSGTTYLTRLLNAHGAVYLTEELRLFAFLRHVLEVAPHQPEDAAAFLLHGEPQKGHFLDILRDDSLRAVERYFRLRAFPATPAVWGDKNPFYADPVRSPGCLEFIDAVLPRARFLHIHRDPAAVVRSLVAKGWAEAPEAAALWSRITAAARRFGTGIGGQRYLEARYDTLLARPEETADRILAFVGLRRDDGVAAFLDRQRHAPELFSEPVSATATRLAAGIETSSADDERLRALVDPRLLDAFGYAKACVP
ncbi:MAG TPA: sulfotransferase [Azospirillum sp.]